MGNEFGENFQALFYHRRIARAWGQLPRAKLIPDANEFHATLNNETFYFLKAYDRKVGPRWVPIYPLSMRAALKRVGIIPSA